MPRRLSGRRPLLALGSIAVTGLALSGCAGDPPGEVLFTSVDQCVADGMNQQVCEAGYQDAMQAHLSAAPRFDGMAACEAQFGAGQCTAAPAAANNNGEQNNGGGGGGFFMPFLAGYVMSSAINNLTDYASYRRLRQSEGYSYGSTPIYRDRSGQTLTPGNGRGANGAVVAPGRTTLQPANVNTRTVARQGFGGRSGGMSFGG